MLNIRDIQMSFGGLKALSKISLDVQEGDIKALIGPNGAGKTTLLNIISGIHRPDRGDVIYSGEKIAHLSPTAVAKRGISRTFQHVELFGNMTVLENVMVGRLSKSGYGFISSGLKLPFVRKSEQKIDLKSEEILAYINLGERKDEYASNLPKRFAVPAMAPTGTAPPRPIRALPGNTRNTCTSNCSATSRRAISPRNATMRS